MACSDSGGDGALTCSDSGGDGASAWGDYGFYDAATSADHASEDRDRGGGGSQLLRGVPGEANDVESSEGPGEPILPGTVV